MSSRSNSDKNCWVVVCLEKWGSNPHNDHLKKWKPIINAGFGGTVPYSWTNPIYNHGYNINIIYLRYNPHSNPNKIERQAIIIWRCPKMGRNPKSSKSSNQFILYWNTLKPVVTWGSPMLRSFHFCGVICAYLVQNCYTWRIIPLSRLYHCISSAFSGQAGLIHL